MSFISTGRAFQASPRKTPLQLLDNRGQGSNAVCQSSTIRRPVEGTGRYYAALWRQHPSSESTGTPRLTGRDQRRQRWRGLLGLAAVPGLKAVSDSANSIQDNYVAESGSGGNGGASNGGGGSWGDGHDSSGVSPPACCLLHATHFWQAQALERIASTLVPEHSPCRQTSQPRSAVAGSGSGGQAGPEAAGHAEKVGGVLEDVVLLDVSGMHCASCSGRVQRLLEAQPHVAAATVSLATETALVRIAIPPAHSSAAGAAGASLMLPACHDTLPT